MTINTNFNAAPHGQINHLQAEAQRLRGEAVADAVLAAARGIGRLLAPLVRIGKRTAVSLARQRQVDRLYAELSQMSDRDLADIGLSRGDIMAVANGTFRREPAPVVELRPAKAPADKPQFRHAA